MNYRELLVDCHAHTSAVSVCCRKNASEIVDEAITAGIDGIILTNHYDMRYVEDMHRYESVGKMAEAHVDEYRRAKAIGDERGFLVMFGVEVSMKRYDGTHVLVYGIDEEFLLEHSDILFYTQAELYEKVHAVGGAVVQAHPLRNGKNVLLDTSYLDGVEISSHILYDGTHYEELSEFAYDNGLILTSGGDYHGDVPHRPYCGMYLPEYITDTKKFAEYLRKTDSVHLLMQEAPFAESCRMIFERKQK